MIENEILAQLRERVLSEYNFLRAKQDALRAEQEVIAERLRELGRTYRKFNLVNLATRKTPEIEEVA